ncbi:MAG: BatD family protein [Candidatus Cloacimonetes bacterium]|nr:BatD family protein [Candidatus Cloacimonadota bacterium]
MKNLKISAIIAFLLIQVSLLISLEVRAFVDKTKIGKADNLSLTIELSGDNADKASVPQLPAIKNFRNRGYSTSSSQSYQIINGKMTANVTKSYVFSLQPEAIGHSLIPPVTIKYKGETYRTQPISVEVIAGSKQSAPSRTPTRSRQQRGRNQTQPEVTNLDENLFIEAVVSKRSCYKDEPITVTYTLFTRWDLGNMSLGVEPQFNGFLKEDL